ncbi:MAG: hypothetical protein Kow0042_25690 [Calditrichia bacterium]
MAAAQFNILEVCFSRSQGGLELYMANISRALQVAGQRVAAVVPRESFLEQRLQEFQIFTYPVTPGRRYLDFRAAKQVANILQEGEIDIIHAHQSADLSTLILAAKWARRGRLVFHQQMESNRKKKDIFHRWVYRNLSGVIAITDRVKEQIIKNTCIAPQKVFRLYYGIDTSRWKPDENQRQRARATYRVSEEDIAVGIVGRLEEGKGQHILLQAVSRLNEYRHRVKILYIGGETYGQSGYLDYLKNLARQLNLEDRVIFTGFQKDVAAVSAALDIVVLGSKKETFGLSLIETMAQNIAAIGTDAGGVREIIAHEENGLLVAPHNAEALADALRRLIGDPALRERLARNARQTVLTKFSLEKHLNQLGEIFQRVAEFPET